MTTEDMFYIDFAGGDRIDLEALRRRQSAFMPDNGHAWVVETVFSVDDPERAMDRMQLDADNFVGVTPITCLLCTVPYRSAVRFHKCPQAPVKS